MGEFFLCPKGEIVPEVLSPQFLGLDVGTSTSRDLSGHATPSASTSPQVTGRRLATLLATPRLEHFTSVSDNSGLTSSPGRKQQPAASAVMISPPAAVGPHSLQQAADKQKEAQPKASSPRATDYDVARRPPTRTAAASLSSGYPSRLRIFQALSPNLIARGRYFGSKNALGQGKIGRWVQLDAPYFNAPGEERAF